MRVSLVHPHSFQLQQHHRSRRSRSQVGILKTSMVRNSSSSHHPWCCCITYEVSDGNGAPIGTVKKGCCSFCCGHDVTNTKEGTTWKVVPNCCHLWCCCFCCKYRIMDANEQEVGAFDRCNYLCCYQKYDVNFAGKMSPTDKLLTMSAIPFLCPVPVAPLM